VAAFRTNLEVSLQLRAIQDRRAHGTRGPQAFGHIAFVTAFSADS
jgi:hypothetical protein